MRTSEEARARFEAEKRAYWEQRDQLLERYAGKWVAIVDGQVVAVGDRSGDVIGEAQRKTGSRSGFAARVGHENRVYRIRSVVTGYYDSTHDPEAPKVMAKLSHTMEDSMADVEFFVDTGADLTVVQEAVASSIGLEDSEWRTTLIAGIGAAAEERSLYAAVIRLAGQDVTVQVDCRDDVEESILGRDVINEFELTVCAKRNEVRFATVDEAEGRPC